MTPFVFRATAVAFLAAAGLPGGSFALPTARQDNDPCAVVGGLSYALPSDALACLTSFPFNETLRQNILTVISRVFDFYTFEDYYLEPAETFQQPAVDIRAEIERLNSTVYDVSVAISTCCHTRILMALRPTTLLIEMFIIPSTA